MLHPKGNDSGPIRLYSKRAKTRRGIWIVVHFRRLCLGLEEPGTEKENTQAIQKACRFQREAVKAGGLIIYALTFPTCFGVPVTTVDKILHGAKADDIPVGHRPCSIQASVRPMPAS